MTYQVKNWFQSLPFKCNLHCYTERAREWEEQFRRREVGLCTLNQVDP
jgi:hypothetical protein